MWPTNKFKFFCCAKSNNFLDFFEFGDNGFSTNTCLPFFYAFKVIEK